MIKWNILSFLEYKIKLLKKNKNKKKIIVLFFLFYKNKK